MIGPKRRAHRLCSGVMLALGAWTIGRAALPAPAWACSTNSNPPPAPSVQQNYANQRFGSGPGLQPYALVSLGTQGCDGYTGFAGNSGGTGSPGQQGGAISSVDTGLTIAGGGVSYPFQTIGASITSVAGDGGAGGTGGYSSQGDVDGGIGGNGGAGGTIRVSFDATFLRDSSNNLVDFGLGVSSIGQRGGDGGAASGTGTYPQNGGAAGAGGSGGVISVTASGAVQANNNGTSIGSLGGGGGQGGYAPTMFNSTSGGNGGNGGAGNTATLQWTAGTVAAGQYGLAAFSTGGDGGPGGGAQATLSTQGGNGGVGGAGGAASVEMTGGTVTMVRTGLITTPSAGIYATSNGGAGGAGGLPGNALGAGGGNGGNGGNGGSASASLTGIVVLNGTNASGQVEGEGVLVQSNGGAGGQGGNESSVVGAGGGGGFAGAGGSASLTVGSTSAKGEIDTAGNFAHGALVQSVGGGGGDGGNANFGGAGGAGAAGGDGGPVTVDAPQAMIIATGKNSAGVLAQSIGGGGGSGGDVTGATIVASLLIGGNGGLGGNGSTVRLNLGNAVIGSLSTLGGAGVLAQSIGGSGGNGGGAAANGSGLISLVVGGDAGGGGTGGAVNVVNAGLVTTYGDHAAGIQAQSIGGGGGKGGSVTSFNAGVLPAASIAIGGRGASGGPGGDVVVGNSGQVTTYGSDADGVLIQSIGGGGGSGGAAAARAIDISPTKYIPAISITVATGGRGGDGNTGGRVSLDNSGLITTAGDGAIGVMAQSVGGGGGTGGDSTAASYSNGPQAGVTISISVTVGGSGGTGGTGGGVSLSNEGLIATLGQDAYGVFAQSVGGGGGTGGGGDASSSAGDAKGSFGASVAVGGTGGTGGDGGAVNLSNNGAITTRGDGSAGVFAQSVGGGGGTAGGGVASAGGGTLSAAVGVGGSGGAGGNGNTVTLTNGGSVVTRGTASIGLSAQSVGGGGGTAGKGGATAGGANPVSSATALFNLLAGGLNFGQTITMIGDDILQLGTVGKEIQASFMQLTGIFSQPQSGAPQTGTAIKINVAVSVGGTGGAAGNGGAVSVTNTGLIATYGAQSDGIYAQSVGGGGGAGGAATSTAKSPSDMPAQSAVAVGGRGGGGGSGGTVTVMNGNGSIQTQGVGAFGIAAQSVGGGGGQGSVAGTVAGSLKSLSVGLGGNGGQGGDGGAVNVTTGTDAETSYAVITTGKQGIGVFAQSVGGGGGLARTMTTDETFDPSKIGINPQGRLADIQGLALNLGGTNGVFGGGGPVTVTGNGAITTAGLDAHAILAQSIGGGGGLVSGGQVIVGSAGASASASASAGAGGGGDGGTVQLQLTKALSTSGDGAYGVIAQSIGGGGGFAGDTSAVRHYQTGTSSAILASTGNGGAVSVGVTGTTVTTSGAYAPAIFAQSVGGGGGLVNYSQADGSATQVQARGTAGGNGAGGSVSVALVGSAILAAGPGSAGILLQSDGKTSGQLSVTIDGQSSVSGGSADPNFPAGQPATSRDAAAIRLLGGANNVITNAGRINAGAAGPSFAILADGSGGNTTVRNTGMINGDVHIGPGAGNLLDNLAGGVVNAPTSIDLGGGLLRNAGTLHVGGIGTVGATTVTGNFVQTAAGTLMVDVAPAPTPPATFRSPGRQASPAPSSRSSPIPPS